MINKEQLDAAFDRITAACKTSEDKSYILNTSDDVITMSVALFFLSECEDDENLADIIREFKYIIYTSGQVEGVDASDMVPGLDGDVPEDFN